MFFKQITISIMVSIFSCQFCDALSQSDGTTVVCDLSSKSLEQCLDSKDLDQSLSIPKNHEEVKQKCLGFKEGMGCVDTYLNQCVNATVRSIIENETVGAKLFFKYLCDSRKFQSDYLHHSECINLIGQDWNVCTQNYRDIIQKEVQKINKMSRKSETIKNYIHFCCARNAYENCVYNSARYKCHPKSAAFVQVLIRILSTERSHMECDKFGTYICSDVCRLHPRSASVTAAFVLFVVVSFLQQTSD